MKKQANWYGLEMLPLYLEMSTGQLTTSVEQLQNLESCKHRPHVLDDYTVDRLIKVFTEQNESLWVFIEQCQKWRTQKPTKKQLVNIEEVENNIRQLEKSNSQILFLAHHFKNHTIDRILEKEDGELAVDFLAGKLYPP